MTLSDVIAIIRRRWPVLLLVPLVAGLASMIVALTAPPRFVAQAQLLVTRSEDRRFDTEDALAYDLPAIVSGAPFAQEVAAELARRGRDTTSANVRAALSASNARRVVTLSATSADRAEAEAMLDAAVMLVQTRGLALWGDPAATPENSGVNVVVLDGLPPRAAPVHTWRTIGLDAAVRALVGLGAGAVLALLIERGRPSGASARSAV
jgi:hypothetical protein